MSHYAVFISFSFVLDTIQARCQGVPWSVVQFRCTQLPKLTVTVTSHYITIRIITLYRLLHFKFIVHLIATYVFHSFHLPYFIRFLPPIFPPSFPLFFPLFFLPCSLSFSLSPTTNSSHASSMYCSI